MLSPRDQIAAAGIIPDLVRVPDVLLGTLPDGITISRPITDGMPADWIDVSRGVTTIDMDEDGHIVNVVFAGIIFDGVAPEELDNLRVLLSLDRRQLQQLADLGPEMRAARAAWNALPCAETRRIAQTVGFAAWFAEWQQHNA